MNMAKRLFVSILVSCLLASQVWGASVSPVVGADVDSASASPAVGADVDSASASPAVGADVEAAPAADTTSDVVSSGSPVITVGGAGASALSTSTSVPDTVYPAGTYQTGRDIPAGEYVVLADPDSSDAGYIITAGSGEYAEVIDYDTFDYNAIITLSDGQLLELQSCSASPIAEIPEIDHYYGRMYKVGYHIPAGSYHLKAVDDYAFCYVLSFPSDSYEAVVGRTVVNDTAIVTAEDGQYLQLLDCILTGPASSEQVKAQREAEAQAAAEAASGSGYGTGLGTVFGGGFGTGEPAGDAQRTSRIVTAGTSVTGLSTVTSTPQTRYPAGTYTVGTDIPAGEYVLLRTEESLAEAESGDAAYGGDILSLFSAGGAQYAISTVPTFDGYETLVDYGRFTYNSIIRLEEGQYLTMEGCTASPIAEVPQIDSRKGSMFKVGYHIPADTYHLQADAGSYGLYFVLTEPSYMAADALSYDLVYGEPSSVTLADGQYLVLMDCRFVSAPAASAGPGGSGSGWNSYLDYFSRLYGLETEETTSPVITVMPRTSNLNTVTSTPETVYPAGTYQVGTDIPAGEYVLLRTEPLLSGASAGYAISTVAEPEEYEQILDYNIFQYNAIIRLEEGQFLTTDTCTASPIDQVPQIDCTKGEMFKVGLHIPAGTYRVTTIEGRTRGYAYALSYPSDSFDAVVDSTMVELNGTSTITVQDGQYLQLSGSVLTGHLDGEGGGPGVR